MFPLSLGLVLDIGDKCCLEIVALESWVSTQVLKGPTCLREHLWF